MQGTQLFADGNAVGANMPDRCRQRQTLQRTAVEKCVVANPLSPLFDRSTCQATGAEEQRLAVSTVQ